MDRMLNELQLAEFVYEQRRRGFEYTFKHALTQEVAYHSLLIERRRRCMNAPPNRSKRCTPTGWRII